MINKKKVTYYKLVLKAPVRSGAFLFVVILEPRTKTNQLIEKN
jgi:hypothetical protein